MPAKHVFVTGGVCSSLGKGITSASLGRLLKERGYKVALQKFDPYLNYDPGTLSPYQHGEVFVTEDGAETDLDLGHYERFTDENLGEFSNVTTGKVYWNVIANERRGDYKGKTVQVIPHVTDEIKRSILQISESEDAPDVVITEIGGTVGDIESQPYLEAIRQVRDDIGAENVVYIHVTLLTYLGKAGELKTKPTQHSVKQLLSVGIQPEVLVLRSEEEFDESLKKKVSSLCNVPKDAVIANYDAQELYEVPLMLEKEGLAEIVCKRLDLEDNKPDLKEWRELVRKAKSPDGKVTVALVGKYVELHDAYLSVAEALRHSGINFEKQVDIKWINSEDVTAENVDRVLKEADAILVPGGFDNRGIEGKIHAIQYARENQVPYLGLCLGLQLAVVEFARNVLGLEDADSTELNENTANPVIDKMPDKRKIENIGGTLRKGACAAVLKEGTLAHKLYGTTDISERHRHRYEVNNEYAPALEEKGMIISGMSPNKALIEMIELKDHPFFIATQGHPEFKSRPNKPHPLFNGFIEAAIDYKSRKKED